MAPKPSMPSMPSPKPVMPSSPARKSKSVGEKPLYQLPASVSGVGSPSLEGHDESPEKLSLKARLKLFEKEIEVQGSTAPPTNKPGECFETLFRVFLGHRINFLAKNCKVRSDGKDRGWRPKSQIILIEILKKGDFAI